jgi:hypothetical protein
MRLPPLFCEFLRSFARQAGPLRLRPLSSADKKKRVVGGAAVKMHRPHDRTQKIIFRRWLDGAADLQGLGTSRTVKGNQKQPLDCDRFR